MVKARPDRDAKGSSLTSSPMASISGGGGRHPAAGDLVAAEAEELPQEHDGAAVLGLGCSGCRRSKSCAQAGGWGEVGSTASWWRCARLHGSMVAATRCKAGGPGTWSYVAPVVVQEVRRAARVRGLLHLPSSPLAPPVAVVDEPPARRWRRRQYRRPGDIALARVTMRPRCTRRMASKTASRPRREGASRRRRGAWAPHCLAQRPVAQQAVHEPQGVELRAPEHRHAYATAPQECLRGASRAGRPHRGKQAVMSASASSLSRPRRDHPSARHRRSCSWFNGLQRRVGRRRACRHEEFGESGLGLLGAPANASSSRRTAANRWRAEQRCLLLSRRGAGAGGGRGGRGGPMVLADPDDSHAASPQQSCHRHRPAGAAGRSLEVFDERVGSRAGVGGRGEAADVDALRLRLSRRV